MEIELKHLTYFVAAAEHRSFRQAANALDVRQSVLSRRIRALEEELGVSLFERDTLGARLTLAGERLQARAKSVLDDTEELLRSGREAGRGMVGNLRIGVICSLGPGFLRDLVRNYAGRHPDVEIGVSEDGPRAHVAHLRDRQLDIAMLTELRPDSNLDTVALWREKVFVALPESHRLANSGVIEWAALSEVRFLVRREQPGPQIHDYVIRHLHGGGHVPSIVRQAVGHDGLMSLVGLERVGIYLNRWIPKSAEF
jgi:DNA-binding transcriptional LysR family regulator